jgi:polysaccharide export outer membrane protein
LREGTASGASASAESNISMKNNRIIFGLVVNGLLALVLLAAAPVRAQQTDSKPSPPPTSQQTSQTGDRYRIGPGDVLDIRIFNRPQLSRDAVRVEGNGMIRMPLIDGEIRAACKTEGELAQDIKTGYLKFYRNPQVDVFIKEYHAREVAVIGAINEQGRYQMQRRLRLLELLTYAKGPSDKAGQTINIVRAPRSGLCGNGADSGEDAGSFLSLRLNDTLRGEEKANPYVEPGDIVTLPEADQVYVVGNVYSPKALPMKEPITVSRAVAMAGGPLRDSKTDRVHIIRQQAGAAGEAEIYVDLKAIARKQAPDVLLQPNDIVEVRESTGKTMIRSLLGVVAPAMGQLPVRVIP